MWNFSRTIIFLIIISSFFSTTVFGHGLGGETHPPVTIGDRNAVLSIDISPSTFDPENSERWVSLRLSDSQDGFELIIEHVTFILELKKDGERIFRYMFHDKFGDLNFRVITNDSDTIEIQGIQESLLGGWMRSDFEPLVLTGPIFQSGGLYEYKVEVVAVDSDNKILDQRIELEGAISLAEIDSFKINDSQDQIQNIQIISYYDGLDSFNFESNQMSFSLPFDWSQDLDQLSVVHEEIKIPSTFEEFLSTRYDLVVNGLPMPEDIVTIDDYSGDERTVHLVLNKELLKQIREKAILESNSSMKFILSSSDEAKFPLQAITPDYRYDISVFWDPNQIKIGHDTSFFVDIQGMFTEKEKTGPIEYDLKLIQNNSEIYSTHIVGTINSDPDEHQIKFKPKDVGSVNLVLSNIGGNSLAKANFIFVVYPDDKLPEFPLTFRSLTESNGEISEGSYDVDVTWFPGIIEPGESEFVFTFYQKGTKTPVKNVDYNFVLIKNGTEILKKEGFTKSGGTFEKYNFAENEIGELTIRIENIAGTSDFIEIPLVVTPEFPMVFLILIISLGSLVLFKILKFTKLRMLLIN